MIPNVVADIGNTRIKCGRCTAGAVADTRTLPPEDSSAWQRQLEHWDLPRPARWTVASVQPERCDRLVAWLRRRGDNVLELRSADQLPLRVLLEHPDWAGIDRLLDGVAANTRRRS